MRPQTVSRPHTKRTVPLGANHGRLHCESGYQAHPRGIHPIRHPSAIAPPPGKVIFHGVL